MPKEAPARQQFEKQLATLIDRFDKHHDEYMRANYSETEVRAEFIDPFFEALGWDLQNRAGRSPKTREVFREAGETHGRVDYVFRIDSRDVFYVEAKAPHVPLERVDVVMQAKRYAWNSPNVFISAVTDFEEFRLYDATAKPDRKHLNAGLIFEYRYTDYLKPKSLNDLWLLSRESVGTGSIDQLLKKSSVQARQRIPVDQAFLDDLSAWREQLAKSVFKANPELSPADLNSIVQVFLDRLIFIRICEDRRIMDPRQLAEVAENWEHSGKRVSMTNDLNALFHEVNDRLNGEIFKPGRVEKIDWDINAALVADIIKSLYFPVSPYLFDKIPVELLGSIYERYLGKTIRVTETRAVVEDKPEVRKAGGVYYTPKYIVDYIVEQTVGKLIEGKTPKQIEKLRILDPACGSGSFLIGAYRKLLDYHKQYYAEHARARDAAAPQARLIQAEEGGELKLSLAEKAAILRNNIYGVDIDLQAVEITMMSLYIKMLEDERGILSGRALLPRLRDNIKCGNSLVARDIEVSGDERDRINPFDWDSKSDGFGEIVATGGFDAVIGNPPYVRQESLSALKQYMQQHYEAYNSTADLYVYFIERGLSVLKQGGLFSFIVSSSFLRTAYGNPLRHLLRQEYAILGITDFGGLSLFADAKDVYVCVPLLGKKQQPDLVQVCNVETLKFDSLTAYVAERYYSLPVARFAEDGWSLVSENVSTVFEKLKSHNETLGGYVRGRIFSGIKTGLNEAFEIDQPTFNAMLEKCPNCRNLIRPFLGGQDIRRYSVRDSRRYLIVIPSGWTATQVEKDEARSQLSERDAWNWFRKEYRPIAQHLEEFADAAKRRQDQGQFWWELRPCDYHDVLSGSKIIYPDIAKEPRFFLDTSGTYISNTAYCLDSQDLYLLGILNSKLSWFAIARVSIPFGTRAGEYRYRLIYQYMENLPIRAINFADPADKARHDKMVALVEKMLDLHNQKQAAKSDSVRERIEREINVTDEQIDALVYELYGLTKDEIKVVEGKSQEG